MRAKSIYVSFTRGVRSVLRASRALSLVDRAPPKSRFACWFRSLLSIYDVEDLARLDVPWWTFEAAAAVEEHLSARREARVFEWGSGASSLWLARRASSVISVEHDSEWAAKMGALLPTNVELRLVEPAMGGMGPRTPSTKPGFIGLDFTSYVKAIEHTSGDFDLIVVDGRAREACFELALDHLAPDGLIVFDNVDRERYVAAMHKHSVRTRTRTTRGLTPTLPYPTRTALVWLRES